MSAGKHTFEVVNAGPQSHEAILVQLAPGVMALGFIEAVESPKGPAPGLPLGDMQGLPAGSRGYFTAEFAPSNYALICFIPDSASGAPHFTLGMVYEFTVP